MSVDADGDFVVVWEGSGNQDGDYTGVYGQRYSATGAAQGGEFRVNTFTSNYQANPAVAMDDGGDFVVTRRPDAREAWNPALYDFTPADQFDVGGSYVNERTIKEGLGAPLVAVGRSANAISAPSGFRRGTT